ncbi:MAG: YdeI/OmpD-associated family protein [Gemmatimonadota bacterium]
MATKNPRVDAYIAKAPAYARPILERVREIYHAASPELVEEIKWGVPYYSHHGLVGGMAAFKKHVSLGFWNASVMEDPEGIFEESGGGSSMCAVKVTSVDDLPSGKVLTAYIRASMALNEAGEKPKQAAARKRPAPQVPGDLKAALEREPDALATFQGFPPSHKREYVEWITEAKRAATRERRIAQAVAWMAEGKPRNWKYRAG